VKDILHKTNLTIARADKNKAIVIIQKDALEQKINTVIQNNHITPPKKRSHRSLPEKNTTGFQNMQLTERKKQAEISYKHKTYCAQFKCIYRNPQGRGTYPSSNK
jgi:hypothetical protein